MIFLKFFLDQDEYSYNMSMILIYILIFLAAFIICVLVSDRLNIYNSRINKNINAIINTKNELFIEALNEVAITSEDIKNTEDKQ